MRDNFAVLNADGTLYISFILISEIDNSIELKVLYEYNNECLMNCKNMKISIYANNIKLIVIGGDGNKLKLLRCNKNYF